MSAAAVLARAHRTGSGHQLVLRGTLSDRLPFGIDTNDRAEHLRQDGVEVRSFHLSVHPGTG